MLTVAKNNIKFILKSLKCNILSAVEYKKSFIAQVLFMMVNNCFFIVFWLVVFDINNGNVNGIIFKDILYLWSVSAFGWGMANFLFGGVKELNRYIITGALDTYILQPKNIFFNIATSKCQFGAFGDLLYGLILGIIASNTIVEFAMLVIYSIIAGIIFLSIAVIMRSFAVWLGDVEEITKTFEETLTLNFSLYPEQIYNNVTKVFLYTIIPAAYISYIPVKLFKQFDIKLFGILIGVTIIYMLIAKVLLKIVLKRYESGNNIALKD